MKFAVILVLISCLILGCSSEDRQLDQAMDLRKSILDADSCSFHAVITADYGDEVYSFQMECDADSTGVLRFSVTDPETISGIAGQITGEEASLTFDNTVLAFPMLAEGQLTPVSAPWIFLNALRGGYLTGCSREEEGICIYIDDSYEENALHLEICTDENTVPVRAEIIWKDRRVLSMDIRNFALM